MLSALPALECSIHAETRERDSLETPTPMDVHRIASGYGIQVQVVGRAHDMVSWLRMTRCQLVCIGGGKGVAEVPSPHDWRGEAHSRQRLVEGHRRREARRRWQRSEAA